MMTPKMDEEARSHTLDELMAAMDAMEQKRLPPGAGRGVTIEIEAGGPRPPEGPGQDFGMGGVPGDDMEGVDPRLAEMIRKKKAGM